MSINQQLLLQFYTAFKNKNYQAMQDCYANDATFNDPVFENLNATEVKAMWKMLISRGKDLQIEFKNINANDNNGSAEWFATYTFSQTNRKVINYVSARFEFENGKIKKHVDSFNFHKWASQALGTKGYLLGWTNFLKQKVQTSALKSLKLKLEN